MEEMVKRMKGLLGDTRGSVMTEYVIAVGVFGLVVGLGLVSAGDHLFFDYLDARDLLLLPAQ